MTDAPGGTVRRGVRLALDWGQARIGVAACDAQGMLAYPVETIGNASDQVAVWKRLHELAGEYEPFEFVLGLPRHLKGVEGASAEGVRARAAQLAAEFPGVGILMVDERLTTVLASRQLREAGRNARNQRSVVDQAAAVAILEQALETERQTGQPGGEVIARREDLS